MKAHGAISAMPVTWDNALLPEIKPGVKGNTAASRCSMATAKQTAMQTVKVSASTFIRFTAIRSRFIHKSPMNKMAAMVSSTSPKYTS